MIVWRYRSHKKFIFLGAPCMFFFSDISKMHTNEHRKNIVGSHVIKHGSDILIGSNKHRASLHVHTRRHQQLAVCIMKLNGHASTWRRGSALWDFTLVSAYSSARSVVPSQHCRTQDWVPIYWLLSELRSPQCQYCWTDLTYEHYPSPAAKFTEKILLISNSLNFHTYFFRIIKKHHTLLVRKKWGYNCLCNALVKGRDLCHAFVTQATGWASVAAASTGGIAKFCYGENCEENSKSWLNLIIIQHVSNTVKKMVNYIRIWHAMKIQTTSWTLSQENDDKTINDIRH